MLAWAVIVVVHFSTFAVGLARFRVQFLRVINQDIGALIAQFALPGLDIGG